MTARAAIRESTASTVEGREKCSCDECRDIVHLGTVVVALLDALEAAEKRIAYLEQELIEILFYWSIGRG